MSNTIYEIISRKEAKEKGLIHYYTGKPCKHGHISLRQVCDWGCTFCVKLRSQHPNTKKKNKEYAIKNYDKIRQWQKIYENTADYKKATKKYRDLNKDTIREYREKNKDSIKKLRTNFYKRNPNKQSEYSRLRNTRLENAITNWDGEPELIKQLYSKRNELNELWGTNLEVDHIIPINPKDKSVCGLHCWANLQLLDKKINSAKGDKYNTDW